MLLNGVFKVFLIIASRSYNPTPLRRVLLCATKRCWLLNFPSGDWWDYLEAGVAANTRVLFLCMIIFSLHLLQHGCAPSMALATDAGLWFSIQRPSWAAGEALSVAAFVRQWVWTWTRLEKNSLWWEEGEEGGKRGGSLRRSRFSSRRSPCAAFLHGHSLRVCCEVPRSS